LRQLCELAKQKTVLLKQAKLTDSSKILRSKTRALIALWTITTIPYAIIAGGGRGRGNEAENGEQKRINNKTTKANNKSKDKDKDKDKVDVLVKNQYQRDCVQSITSRLSFQNVY
jgi:hypothetical protein